ncbi:hypothetical protein [Acinetobacter sp. ANC 4641]|uniref:hypothetical protein n=1 Tax=Acinetobacter sp. ANC 4641 TaxID=2529847 RepID=UPI00103D0DE3|nr:hypothetical protein [Acinetobacter sp. ANC 4641]TCB11152.1 hypothetical protein E0H78_09085 [Acinetobacter sp. ANC 4641]
MKYRMSPASSHIRLSQVCLHPWRFGKHQIAQYCPDLKSISIGIFDGEFEDAQTRQQQVQQLGVHKCFQSAYRHLFFN